MHSVIKKGKLDQILVHYIFPVKINYSWIKQIITLSLILFFGVLSSLKAQNGVTCKTYSEYVKAATEKDLSMYYSYDIRNKIYYVLANDSNYLYVRILITDDILQKKIIVFGNTFWIDITNGKNRKLGIQFPIVDSNNPPQPPKKGKDDFSLIKYELLRNYTKAKLIGFSDKQKDSTILINTNSGFKFRLYFDENRYLIQEYRIPLKEIYPNFKSTQKLIFSIGIITGFLKNAQMQPPQGGGDRQGPPPGDSAPTKEMEEMAVQSKMWILNIKFNR